jgi:hypothetical protein
LKKDPRTNRVIGFEKLNFTVDKASDIKDLPVEVVIS